MQNTHRHKSNKRFRKSYECFDCMHACVPCACKVSPKVNRGCKNLTGCKPPHGVLGSTVLWEQSLQLRFKKFNDFHKDVVEYQLNIQVEVNFIRDKLWHLEFIQVSTGFLWHKELTLMFNVYLIHTHMHAHAHAYTHVWGIPLSYQAPTS